MQLEDRKSEKSLQEDAAMADILVVNRERTKRCENYHTLEHYRFRSYIMDGYDFDHGEVSMIHVDTGASWKACPSSSADDTYWFMISQDDPEADVKIITKDELLNASIWMPDEEDDDDSSACDFELEDMAIEREKDECDPSEILENVHQILADAEQDKADIVSGEEDRFKSMMAKGDVSFEDFCEHMMKPSERHLLCYTTDLESGKMSVHLSPFMNEHELSTPYTRFILKKMLKIDREQQREQEDEANAIALK